MRHAVLRFAVVIGVACVIPLAAARFYTTETVTIADTAVGLDAATHSPTGRPQMTHCLGRLDDAPVRFWTSADVPTSTTGILLSVGDTLTLESHADLVNLRLIRTGDESGTLQIQCWVP